jgi:hypothetical protein
MLLPGLDSPPGPLAMDLDPEKQMFGRDGRLISTLAEPQMSRRFASHAYTGAVEPYLTLEGGKQFGTIHV